MNLIKMASFIVAPIVALQAISCQSTIKKNQESETKTPSIATASSQQSWPSQMQQLTENLSVLMPIVTDPKSFHQSANKPLLEQKMTELKNLAHNINESTPNPDKDPSLKLIGRRFEENLKLSLDSFQSGHLEFSRSVFKNALAQCVQCHTRLEVGPALAQPQFLNTLQKVAIVERVQFLIASRYFDEAMNEIEAATAKGDGLSIVAWQKLVQMGLIITVRFRNDPAQAEKFISIVSQNQNLPYFIKRQLPFWQQSVKAWMINTKAPVNLKTAQQLVDRAEAAQKISRSEGGTVDYLRAGSLLHKFLAKSQAPSEKSEALFQLGMIYENIGEIGAWSMNEDYYELCIRTQPHSEIAKKCFARYQESTISGFSGTGGLYIPDDIQTKMNELRAVAL
ncbi:MAG: hypothetical protein RJB66_1286 [Pseudomonadota bacterium]|jgi:hypothetical protein